LKSDEAKPTNCKLALVADKNEHDNLILCECLENQGYGTVSVFQYSDVRKMFEKFLPDLVVIDSCFEQTGEIVKFLRSNDQKKNVPIMLIRNKYYYPDTQSPSDTSQSKKSN
jgi:DNA-binding response OmpR family regulator